MDKIDAILQTLNFPSFYIKLIFSFLISFLITYFSIPTIIKISRRKNLMDEPGQRSSHERKIPNLGGIAMFFSISVCACEIKSEPFIDKSFGAAIPEYLLLIIPKVNFA